MTMVMGMPMEARSGTTPFQLVILAPCANNCIAEGMDKLVVTEANPDTGDEKNTTMQDFQTSSDVYRPVAVLEFKEVSAQARKLWVNNEASGLHAACLLYMDQAPEPDKNGTTWELNDLKDPLMQREVIIVMGR